VCISVFASSFRCTRGGLFGLYYVADAVIFVGLAVTGATIVHYSLKGKGAAAVLLCPAHPADPDAA